MKTIQHSSPKVEEIRREKPGQPKRFVIVKLEERIAPTCHTNPHGNQVGCGGHQISDCFGCFCL